MDESLRVAGGSPRWRVADRYTTQGETGNPIVGGAYDRGVRPAGPGESAQTGSDTCKRYKRFAVSGWEYKRGESKLREMKSDPTARADDRAGHPYHEATGGFYGLKLAGEDYD